MSTEDEQTDAWVRDIHSGVRRAEGAALRLEEIELVRQFVAGRLDEIDASYVAEQAAKFDSWDRAVSEAILTQPDDEAADPPDLQVARPTLRYDIQLEPIAALAAADSVKVSQRWDRGHVRMLQTAMRPDLAIDVQVDEPLQEDFADTICIVRVSSVSPAVAVLPGGSPVFTGWRSEEFLQGFSMSLNFIPTDAMDAEQMSLLRVSLRNLRNAASIDDYKRLINRFLDP